MRSKRSDDLDPGKTGLRNHRVNHKMWDLPTRNPEDRSKLTAGGGTRARSSSEEFAGLEEDVGGGIAADGSLSSTGAGGGDSERAGADAEPRARVPRSSEVAFQQAERLYTAPRTGSAAKGVESPWGHHRTCRNYPRD